MVKIQNGHHMWEEENVLKMYVAHISCGSKILTKSLYLAQLRRQKQICVFLFLAKIRKFKMAAIFGEGKIFWKLPGVHLLDTLWVENFDKITLSRMVREIEANLCFAIFGKNSNRPPFLGRGTFFKNCQEHIP